MLHIVLHFVVPAVVARGFYASRWRAAWLTMLLGWLVDVDHLLANPIYDPGRCSIDFHPLHSLWAIAFYLAIWLLTVERFSLRFVSSFFGQWRLRIHWVATGLLIHMLLDAIDCVV